MDTIKNDEDLPVRWEWWAVKKGEWIRFTYEMDWLAGELLEMAREYGVISDTPILDIDKQFMSITVYGLRHIPISANAIQAVVECKNISRLAGEARSAGNDEMATELEGKEEAVFDSWADNSPESWLYFFEHVYPSSHLVYIHYMGGIDAYGIFCNSYKDMLDVVGKVTSAQ